jgi:hypothetical protein
MPSFSLSLSPILFAKIISNLQASLNHRANACSCFPLGISDTIYSPHIFLQEAPTMQGCQMVCF